MVRICLLYLTILSNIGAVMTAIPSDANNVARI